MLKGDSKYVLAIKLTALLGLSACGGSKDKNIDRGLYTFDEEKTLSLPLDSATSQETSYIQLINDSTLSFFNSPTYDICLYDLNKKKLIDKIKIYREGPNAVNGITAYCIQSPDSIWLFQSWGTKVTLINKEGEVKNNYDVGRLLKEEDDNLGVSPYPSSETPYTVFGGKHLLQGMAGGIETGKTPGATVLFDPVTNKIETANEYPELYGEAADMYENWHPFAYMHTTYTLSPKGEIVTSFPASDSLYVYNPRTREKRSYYAAYSKPTDIKPGTSGKLGDAETLYLGQYAYKNILYDKTTGLYYRLLSVPFEPTTDNLTVELTKKPIVAIMLDSDFNIVGECQLPEDRYYSAHTFVNSHGLHVNTVSDDDDYMTFKVLAPVKRNSSK